MLKRDTMHRSSNGLLLLALISFCPTAPLLAQAGQNASQPSSQAQNQQQQPGQQQPVHDLTPPSDAETERAAQPAPAPTPNQPTDTTKVPAPPENKNSDKGYYFRKDVEEVMLYATVVDPKNRMVTNLDKTSFSVFEDGQPQQITSFRREDIPVSMGILIDNSGSMRDKRPAVNQATLNLVRASRSEERR